MKLYLEARNLHRCIILNQKFDCGIYFCQTTFFDTFLGHSKGQVLVKKDQKLPISLKIPPGVANLHRGIIYHETFDTVIHLGQITTFDYLWGILGLKCGSKIEHLAKPPQQKQKICTGSWISFHEKFDVVTYLLHTTVSHTFWGTLGVKKGQKLSK